MGHENSQLEYIVGYVGSSEAHLLKLLEPSAEQLTLLQSATPLNYNVEAAEAFKVGVFMLYLASAGGQTLQLLNEPLTAEYIIREEETLSERALLVSQDHIEDDRDNSIDRRIFHDI